MSNVPCKSYKLFFFLGILEWLMGISQGQWMGFLTRDTLLKAKKLVSTTILNKFNFMMNDN